MSGPCWVTTLEEPEKHPPGTKVIIVKRQKYNRKLGSLSTFLEPFRNNKKRTKYLYFSTFGPQITRSSKDECSTGSNQSIPSYSLTSGLIRCYIHPLMILLFEDQKQKSTNILFVFFWFLNGSKKVDKERNFLLYLGNLWFHFIGRYLEIRFEKVT